MEILSIFFDWCVDVMVCLSEFTGISYKAINSLVFLILQPSLIFFFFILWTIEKKR